MSTKDTELIAWLLLLECSPIASTVSSWMNVIRSFFRGLRYGTLQRADPVPGRLEICLHHPTAGEEARKRAGPCNVEKHQAKIRSTNEPPTNLPRTSYEPAPRQIFSTQTVRGTLVFCALKLLLLMSNSPLRLSFTLGG